MHHIINQFYCNICECLTTIPFDVKRHVVVDDIACLSTKYVLILALNSPKLKLFGNTVYLLNFFAVHIRKYETKRFLQIGGKSMTEGRSDPVFPVVRRRNGEGESKT